MKKIRIVFLFLASVFFSGVSFSASWFGKSDAEKHEENCKELGYGMSDSAAELALEKALTHLNEIEVKLAASQKFLKDVRDSGDMPFDDMYKFFSTLSDVQRDACKVRSFFRPPRRSGANAGMYNRQGISELLKDDVLSDDELSNL